MVYGEPEKPPYTRKQIESMSAVDEPLIVLPEWLDRNGKSVTVRMLESEKHFVQYDEVHGIYRVAERQPRIPKSNSVRGVTSFNATWFEAL